MKKPKLDMHKSSAEMREVMKHNGDAKMNGKAESTEVVVPEDGLAGEQAGDADCPCCCHQKATPRSEQELKQLKNRISRMVGQLNGIGRMLDENRYCGDILTQVAAVESALQSFGYLVLQDHMETCVVEEIKKGNLDVIEETVELVKKLK